MADRSEMGEDGDRFMGDGRGWVDMFVVRRMTDDDDPSRDERRHQSRLPE